MDKCKAENCEKTTYCRGYCNAHYRKLLKYGDPNVVKMTRDGSNRRRNKTYGIYYGIRTRCLNKNDKKNYDKYGAKGITICDRWLGIDGYKNFVSDMGERPEGMSIDRIDNNGNYEPSNCRWANIYQQMGNMSRNNKDVGVHFYKKTNKWMASIRIKKKQIKLGYYVDYNDAVKARKDAEIKYGIKY